MRMYATGKEKYSSFDAVSCLCICNLNSHFVDNMIANLMTYLFLSLQVLVNDRTASASEIVSSSISEYIIDYSAFTSWDRCHILSSLFISGCFCAA